MIKIAPAWDTRTDTLLESASPGFGSRLAIERVGAEAVLTASCDPAAPPPPKFSAPQALEVHGVAFHAYPAVLEGRHALQGRLPIADAKSLFAPAPPPAGTEGPSAPWDAARQDPPAGDAEPARKGLAAKAREFAEARDELAAARARLPELASRATELRQKLESVTADLRKVERSVPALEAAARESEQALTAILRGRE